MRHRRRRRRKMLLASIVIVFFLVISLNYNKVSNPIIDRVVSASLSNVKMPAVKICGYDLSEIQFPDISLARIFTAVTDFKEKAITFFKSGKNDYFYPGKSDKHEEKVTFDESIRLSDVCIDVEQEKISDAARGAANIYFGFWSSMIDEYCLGVEPVIWELEKDRAEQYEQTQIENDTEVVLE